MIHRVDFQMSPKGRPLHDLFLAKQVLGFLIEAAKEYFYMLLQHTPMVNVP